MGNRLRLGWQFDLIQSRGRGGPGRRGVVASGTYVLTRPQRHVQIRSSRISLFPCQNWHMYDALWGCHGSTPWGTGTFSSPGARGYARARGV